MPYCPNCGTESQGAFCASCGTRISAAGRSGSAPPPPPPPLAQSGLDENVAGALCYLLGVLTGVLFLVLEPYNRSRNVRFHAFQSIFAGLGVFLTYFVLLVLASVPIIGTIFSLVSALVLPLAILVLWLMLMFKAYNNQRLVLPIIGPLAERQAAV